MNFLFEAIRVFHEEVFKKLMPLFASVHEAPSFPSSLYFITTPLIGYLSMKNVAEKAVPLQNTAGYLVRIVRHVWKGSVTF